MRGGKIIPQHEVVKQYSEEYYYTDIPRIISEKKFQKQKRKFQRKWGLDESFVDKPGRVIYETTNAYYYGGHKRYLTKKEVEGFLILTEKYLIFREGGGLFNMLFSSWYRYAIIVPLERVLIEGWSTHEEVRRQTIMMGFAGGFAGLAGGFILPDGKKVQIILPYIDENNVPQVPRFSVGRKGTEKLAQQIYDCIVKLRKERDIAKEREALAKEVTEEDPLVILKLRLAKGEISKGEYEDLKRALE